MTRYPDHTEWVVYVRISDDREGAGLGVQRQERECRELVDRLGGSVLAVLVDNDLTANARSGRWKARTGYNKIGPLLQSAPGKRGVVAWHTDRLHRTPRELEDFIEIIEKADAPVETVKSGPINLATSAGRMHARIACAVAAHESDHKAERIRSKVVQLAMDGKIANGGPRPFGYTRIFEGVGPRRKIVRDEICEEEAAIIREWAARLLAGESKYSILKDAKEKGIKTSTGKYWSTQALHWMMRSGRIAGLREHKGITVGPAEWPAIISRETHEELCALLADWKASKVRRPRKHWMTGLIFCSEPCNSKMRAARVRGQLRYGCPPRIEGGCNGRVIKLDELKEMVETYLMARMRDAELLKELAGYRQDATGATKKMVDKITADESRLTRLQASLEDGDEDALPEVVASIRNIRARIADTRVQLASRVNVPAGLLTDDLAERWHTLALEQKTALAKVFIERVEILPAKRGLGRFDPDRVVIVPRRIQPRNT